MIKLITYLLQVLYLPIWFIIGLFPRNRNLWIFGGWLGTRFTDNAKYVFETANAISDEIDCVWLTRSQEVLAHCKGKGYRCYHIWSWKGVWLSLRAGRVIFSSGKPDVNPFLINGAVVYQLWHGAPMKKIGLDDKLVHRSWVDKFKKVFLPFIYDFNIDYVLSTSACFDSKMSSAFGVEKSKVMQLGYPRNDVFFNASYKHPIISEINKKYSEPFIVIYLPTFRNGQVDLFFDYQFDQERMSKLMEQINGVLLLKSHFADGDFGTIQSDRIIQIKDSPFLDINEVMKDTDLLITDYSGAYFDFLLADKPIIFSPFDLEDYLSKSRELYFNYNEITCAPRAKDWKQIERFLSDFAVADNQSKERQKLKAYFNGYQKGKSSQELYEFIKVH